MSWSDRRRVDKLAAEAVTACSPQVWATAAPLLLLRAMLGLEARHGTLTLDPVVPQEMAR